MAEEKQAKAKPEKTAAKPDKAAKADKAKKGEAAAEKPKGKVAAAPKDYTPRLRKLYDDEIKAKLKEQFGYSNVMQIPRLTKIVLNMGVGEATQDSKLVQIAASELERIAGQKVMITKSKKAIAQFKIRENLAIGAKVTLRKTRMYEFLDRLITIALPRVRDFRGLSERSFDGRGNYAMGIKEHLIFPEIDYDKIDRVWGMDIIICTSANTDDEARALIEAFNFPFRRSTRKAAA